MHGRSAQQGVTLVELLIVLAVLSLVLGGIYGLLNSAHKTYLNTRAFVESQQTSRVAMNYLTYRLREIDGGGSGSLGVDPRECTRCHIANTDDDHSVNDPDIPCPEDVLIPRRNLFLENLTTLSTADLPDLPDVDQIYKNPSGRNSITFWADLLPAHGLSDTFSDSPAGHAERDGQWKLTLDNNGDGQYDPDEDRELLYYDHNDNGTFDYYAERWTLKLWKPPDREYYELVESLSFGNFSSNNQSTYPNAGYTDEPVAYGITGLDIQPVARHFDQTDFDAKLGSGGVRDSCSKSGCHVEYGSDSSFVFSKFVETHPWWNIKGFDLDLVSVDPLGKKFIRAKQYVIPRNLEVNAE